MGHLRANAEDCQMTSIENYKIVVRKHLFTAMDIECEVEGDDLEAVPNRGSRTVRNL
jgi:hypothetical protein